MAKKKNTARKLSIPKDPKVFEFKVSLPGTKPLVWRSLLAHEFIELEELHGLIQITMGWNSYHLYQFQIGDVIYTDAETASELKNAKVISGQVLHEVLGDNKKFSYTYDFGDDWLHEIEIVATHPHDSRMQYRVCIGGSNAAPPDDCGGGVATPRTGRRTLRA